MQKKYMIHVVITPPTSLCISIPNSNILAPTSQLKTHNTNEYSNSNKNSKNYNHSSRTKKKSELHTIH
jgi:hypothetical protein